MRRRLATSVSTAALVLGAAAAPAQVITHYSAGISASAGLAGITAGPDGNLWFTEHSLNRVGRITPAGVVTEFNVGGPALNPAPFGITVGPDGNLWFTEYSTDRIGRITTSGVVTEFGTGITLGAQPYGITAGPDGNLWFTESNKGRIGRITTSGVVTEFSAGISVGSRPGGITVGPDGNLWFTEDVGGRVGRITTSGVATEFGSGITPGATPYGITAGPDGRLWFTEFVADRIGRITTGVVAPSSLNTLSPCRVLDTRSPAGPLGGPALEPSGFGDRVFVVAGACGIPADATAISVNLTVTNTAAGGHLSIYRGDGVPTGTWSISFGAGQTRANNAVLQLALDGTGSIAVQNSAAGTVDFILDVNGFFR